ncbi:MAG: sigma-70 family RNA polymerase sigma factor [Anaeromyxobacter sp.]
MLLRHPPPPAAAPTHTLGTLGVTRTRLRPGRQPPRPPPDPGSAIICALAQLAPELPIARPLFQPRQPARPAEPPVVDLAEAADLDAVERTLAGDGDAFAGVVRRHASGLVSVCSRLVNDPRLGEELAQEAFARAYARLGSFRGECRFKHWLYRIAVNGCRDFLKAGARSERPSALDGDELWTSRDPERDAAARQAVQALSHAVAALPAKYREAFTLFHLENMPYEEIAAATGVRVNALKVRVHRARLMLRERLGDLLDEEVTP